MTNEFAKSMADLMEQLARYPHEGPDPFADMDPGQLWMWCHDLASALSSMRQRLEAVEAKYEQCREAHAALIQTHVRVMDEKNALVLEVKQWRATKETP